MKKFKNKYRTSSIRLSNWNYGWNAAYFITFCTANRACFFGNIQNGEMNLSEIGKLANQFLMEIPERYDYADLDEFVVMPNHVHLILHIKKINDGHNDGGGGNAINRVSTSTKSQQNHKKPGGITGNNNPMLHDNISRILNWYKGRVTFESRKINVNFVWQSRFYDHIVRDGKSYQRIKNYIINNPKNWNKDSLCN